jgi:predicted secreted hydrolase
MKKKIIVIIVFIILFSTVLPTSNCVFGYNGSNSINSISTIDKKSIISNPTDECKIDGNEPVSAEQPISAVSDSYSIGCLDADTVKKSSVSDIIKESDQFSSYDNLKFTKNPWTPEDEGDHFPCALEWWWIYATLTLDNGEHWDVALMFSYWMNRTRKGYDPGISYYRVQSWNRESGECYDYVHLDMEYPNPYFHHKKNVVDLKYHNCTMKGLYPNYLINAEDKDNNISFNIKYHSESIPIWVANESTKGTLPYGISGIIRYGLILRNNITGNISINGSTYNVAGFGYYEHQFGDMNALKPFKIHSVKELIEIVKLYSKIGSWWANEVITNTREPIRKIHFSTDCLLGYDWIWVTFDNGYSIALFRVVAFGQVEGRVPALLMLTNGKTCWEFGDVYLDFKDMIYIKEYGIYIPLDMELTAYKGDKIFHIFFDSTTDITLSSDEGKILGNFLVAGVATGYFFDGEKNHSLEGVGTNTPGRYLLNIKHRSIKTELIVPPTGIGINISMISYKLGYEIYFKIQFKPFEFFCSIKKVEDLYNTQLSTIRNKNNLN